MKNTFYVVCTLKMHNMVLKKNSLWHEFLQVTLLKLFKMRNENGIPDKCQQPTLTDRLTGILWYEFDFDGKFGRLIII